MNQSNTIAAVILGAAAGVALIEMAMGKHAVSALAALRADEAGRPAPTCERLAAPLLATVEGHETGLRETLLKLDAIACHHHLPECARKSSESLGRMMA